MVDKGSGIPNIPNSDAVEKAGTYLKEQTATFSKSIGSWYKDLSKQAAQKAKSAKNLSMTVVTKVDFLGPTYESVKRSSSEVWRKVPPPAQQVAPYVAVALLTGITVHKITSRHATQNEAKLLAEIKQVNKNRDHLSQLLRTSEVKLAQALKDNTRAEPQKDLKEMAHAVAEATHAAASAAAAAAEAANYCNRRTAAPQHPKLGGT
ncbi:hypothetical protein CYMTET_41945 [Cymbomonas tetramitiformis]|uniref:Uncharacterized protein n=1 Tax=Cymbomonas tetramitiformis TaxID=36881 RepID=A0AAE0C667_9CHLO|nr:hypothetical protein CYMTET_41945 [Cymbomonas tetramitiformis]